MREVSKRSYRCNLQAASCVYLEKAGNRPSNPNENKMKVFTTSVGITLAAGALAFAGPINRAHVAAQPLWVLHFDGDALRPTQTGQYLLGELQKPEAQDKFAAFQVMFNFDPRQHLHGVTLYSTTEKPEDGVLVVYADFEAQRLVTLAKAAKEYQSITHGQNVIHSWLDEKKRKGQRVYAAIQGQSIIFGQRAAAVAASLDVRDSGSSLQQSGVFPQLAGSSSFIQAASRKIEANEGDPTAAVLKLAKVMRFELGESQQKVNAALTVEAGTEEVAGHIASIGRGFLALTKLQTQKPEAAKLAQNAILEQAGANVVCSWSLPASEAVDLLKAAAARNQASQAQ